MHHEQRCFETSSKNPVPNRAAVDLNKTLPWLQCLGVGASGRMDPREKREANDKPQQESLKHTEALASHKEATRSSATAGPGLLDLNRPFGTPTTT